MFDPSTIVESAGALLLLAPDAVCEEAFTRGVMNRAYYCAYGRLRAAIENKHPGVFSNKGAHKTLCGALTAAADPHVTRIGTRLNNLRESRVSADYDYDDACTTAQAEICLDKCTKVLKKIDRLTRAQEDQLADAFKLLIGGQSPRKKKT